MSNLVELKTKTLQLTALIVEDSVTIQKQMKIFLEKLFGKVYVANDGVEGLKIFNRVKPDIILTDLQMPNMDGHEFIENLKKCDDKFEIIVFSAYGQSENVLKFLRMGVTDFIQKPVNFTELTSSLIKAVNNITNSEIQDSKSFNDEILDELEFVKNKKAPVNLISHYKGIPLIHSAIITSVTKDGISIKTQNIQKKAILVKKRTYIETDKLVIEASYSSFDKNNDEIILDNLKKIGISPAKRETLRITPDKDFTVTAFSKNERFSLKCNKISTKSIEFYVKFFDENSISLNDVLNLTLGFTTQYTSTYHNTVTHKERVDCKGNVIKIEPWKDSFTKIVMLLDLRPADKKILDKYIYQREIEIVKEFKNLALE